MAMVFVGKRLFEVSKILKCSKTDLASIKFRTVYSNNDETDEFGMHFSNSFLFDNEYEQIEKQLKLFELGRSETLLFSGGMRIFAPAEMRSYYWFRHETGPEIIGMIAGIAGIVSMVIAAINLKINLKNQEERNRPIEYFRIEGRLFKNQELRKGVVDLIPIDEKKAVSELELQDKLRKLVE